MKNLEFSGSPEAVKNRGRARTRDGSGSVGRGSVGHEKPVGQVGRGSSILTHDPLHYMCIAYMLLNFWSFL